MGICNCNHHILIDDIEYFNKCNEEGEEYFEIYFRCQHCSVELEFSEWGWIDCEQEAIDSVDYKIHNYDN